MYCRSAVTPESGMLGDNIEVDDCDILQYCTWNSCCDPPLNFDFHRTTADVVLHTTYKTVGAVGLSKMYLKLLNSLIIMNWTAIKRSPVLKGHFALSQK